MIPYYDGYQGAAGDGQQQQQQQQAAAPGAMAPPAPPILTPTRDVEAFKRCVQLKLRMRRPGTPAPHPSIPTPKALTNTRPPLPRTHTTGSTPCTRRSGAGPSAWCTAA